jgi:hypothetical protein
MVKIVEFSNLDKETGLDFNPADDLTVFMRNDPMFYRKHYFPVMAKIADRQDRGDSIDAASLISPVVDQGINIYCKKFNIKQRPDEIFPAAERAEIVKKIYSEEMPQLKKGNYRLKK